MSNRSIEFLDEDSLLPTKYHVEVSFTGCAENVKFIGVTSIVIAGQTFEPKGRAEARLQIALQEKYVARVTTLADYLDSAKTCALNGKSPSDDLAGATQVACKLDKLIRSISTNDFVRVKECIRLLGVTKP
jgi:hypothetical protein